MVEVHNLFTLPKVLYVKEDLCFCLLFKLTEYKNRCNKCKCFDIDHVLPLTNIVMKILMINHITTLNYCHKSIDVSFLLL